MRRREADTDGLPPGRTRISSPSDIDARWAAKGDDLFWNGYKVHICETCNIPEPPATPGGALRAEPPNVITTVSTTDATVPDTAMTTPIHAALDRCGLLPAEHYVDSGYPSAALVLDCLQQYGIPLLSPLLAEHSPQAKAGAGYDRASFTIDFDRQQATCPQGRTSSWWNPTLQRGTDVVTIKFAATCGSCPVREQCTRSVSPKFGCQLTVPPRQVHHAQLAARVEQNTKTGRPATRPEPASNPPSAKASPCAACATPVTTDSARPTSNTSTPPPRSTSSVLMPGGTDTPSTAPEPATSPASNSPSQPDRINQQGRRRRSPSTAGVSRTRPQGRVRQG
jgi:Transposase DDE domain